jgi:hypothetical protein
VAIGTASAASGSDLCLVEGRLRPPFDVSGVPTGGASRIGTQLTPTRTALSDSVALEGGGCGPPFMGGGYAGVYLEARL